MGLSNAFFNKKQFDTMNEHLRFIGNVLKDGRGGVCYGFHIDGSESDPYERVTYLEDAVGMTPAAMNFTSGSFDWGSWRNAFFIPRPCMLKFDGTVDYYLDEADYSKKADGVTASDIASDAYGGNAMMEWGRDNRLIWYAIVPDAGDDTSASIYIADHQVDERFNCWSFIDAQGNIIPHFYTPIYNGFSDSNDVMRSLSGKTPTASLTAATERTRCRNNNASSPIWDTEVYADVILINLLLVLISKSTNSEVFGKGKSSGGQSGVINTGTMNDKGLFWGASAETSGVKVFGMENWWGNLWRRFGGLVNVNGTAKYKLTRGPHDGSVANDYVISATAADYAGYKVGKAVPASISGTYIDAMYFDSNQFTPKSAGGSDSTYYCDGLWTNNGQVDYAFRGGYSSFGLLCGAFCLSLTHTASFASWSIAAAPSCKPLL